MVYNIRLKRRVITHYGACCARCHLATIEALTLHHIEDDGADHRRELSGSAGATGKVFYRNIEKAGYPDGLMVLCANCHMILHALMGRI